MFVIMAIIKTICVVLLILYLSNAEGSDTGYNYVPSVNAHLKLHEAADWQTARMTCHDEDAIMAAPWNQQTWSNLLDELLTNSTTSIYAGVQEHYPDGIYTNKDGVLVLSRNTEDTMDLTRCVVYSNYSRELVDCRRQFPYVCYRPYRNLNVTPACEGSVLTCADYKLDERTGSCYKFHAYSLPWNDTYRTCQEEGAHLVIVNSDTEANVLKEIFARYPFEALNGTHPLWGVMAVGFYYWKEADTYITIEGETIEDAGYARWSSGNPSSRGMSKFGGGMFRSGLLDDVDKSYRVPFICEKEPTRSNDNCLSDRTF